MEKDVKRTLGFSAQSARATGGIPNGRVRRSAAVASAHLLWVAGHVRQHGGHMEHDLIALVGGVQGVGSRGIG